jgi:hypothetical protein
MDRAGHFLAAVEAVEAGTATDDQAHDVLAVASLCGRTDLAAQARAIIDGRRTKKKAA